MLCKKKERGQIKKLIKSVCTGRYLLLHVHAIFFSLQKLKHFIGRKKKIEVHLLHFPVSFKYFDSCQFSLTLTVIRKIITSQETFNFLLSRGLVLKISTFTVLKNIFLTIIFVLSLLFYTIYYKFLIFSYT